jgi:hypothetical protein
MIGAIWKWAALAMGAALLVVAAVSAVQGRQLDDARTTIASVNTELDRVRTLLASSESARQSEREQCATDFAGEVERGKIEIAKASMAASARASITGLCPPRATTQAERNAALKRIAGEAGLGER